MSAVLLMVSQKCTRDCRVCEQDCWSDEALFKLTGTASHHNCIDWSPENPDIQQDKAVTLLGLTVWCGMSSGCSKGLSFFEGTVTGPVYPNMFQTSSVPAICQLYGNEEF